MEATVPPESLFDHSDEYVAMLERGLSLSGEGRDFYMEGRVRDLRSQLDFEPKRILDFGCGTGETAAHLAQQFPEAEVLGIDVSKNAIARAARVHASTRVRFGLVEDFDGRGTFDLCYSNGVLHHVKPPERLAALAQVHAALRPGGKFALMENNPWNLGTRLVMRRIPFDRDAVLSSPPATRALLRRVGFEEIAPARYLFWFPRFLAPLRALEPALVRVPFGAQYYFLATRS